MERIRIGVDKDDVVGDFNRKFVPFANEEFGTNVDYNTARSFNFEEVYGVPMKDVLILAERFCHTAHHLIQPEDGALAALTDLARDFDLPVITSRCETLRSITEEWLYAHGFTMLREVHFTNTTSQKYQYLRRKKSEVCLELGVRVHIEDAPHNAIDIAGVGIPVILMDRSWNQDLPETDGVYRVGNHEENRTGWDEVPSLVRSLIT